ncbi:unnamed protein product [Arctia plantaginis]|uniref:DUF4817 domain-containing protein n=1 Tax=Arctia plantaginis TaxID=874455 RepID=A0A8S0Z0C5_ARCPL|nr:unnamed protein product [Arctia plantaginis]
MYHFPTHQFYNQNAYQQQCPMYVDNNKHASIPVVAQISCETVQHNLTEIQPEVNEPQATHTTTNCLKKKANANKGRVDTSNFTIEERLVAAVWVHERKNTKSSMSQIKRDFRERFDREPPAKNTLVVWERKLFSTGSVHDAPRAGRPINRLARTAEVAASVRAAPGLSVRARARALRLPRTTLRTILRADLPHAPPPALAGKQQTKAKKRKKLKPTQEVEHGVGCGQLVRSGYP